MTTTTIQTIACGSTDPRAIRAAQEFPAKLFTVHGDKIRIRDSAVYFGNGSNPSSKGKGIDVSCSVCGHEWSPRANNLLKGQGCPECKRLKAIDSAGMLRTPHATREEKSRAIELKATGMPSDAVRQQLFDEGLSPQLRSGMTINCWVNPEQAEKSRQYNAKRRQDPAKREQERANSRRYQKEFEHGRASHRAKTSKRRALECEALFSVLIEGTWQEVNMYDYLETWEDREKFVAFEDCEAYASMQATAKELAEIHGEQFDIDHLVPLSRGGLHCKENFKIVPASHNRSKGNRLVPEDGALFCKRIFNIS